jgi:hypothetical protein
LKAEELASAVERLPSLRGDKPSEKPKSGDCQSDLDLQRVIDAWPKLSADVRRTITAITASAFSAKGEHT